MPYILRDENGKITRASVRNLVGGEFVAHGVPELVEFLQVHGQDPQQVEETLAELRVTDNEMSRAIEDVIMVLLKKNVIKMPDLPRQVQDRMAQRVKLRTKIEEIYEKASKH